MQSLKIAFPGASGATLAARLESPEGKARAYAVFAHCFTCGKDSSAAVRISRALAAHGIAVLRFDFTGLGQSDGDFANTNFSSNVADLIAAARHLGGAAVIAAAHALPDVRAVATIGAPVDVAHVAHHFDAHADEIAEKGEAEVTLAGRRFTVKRQFVEDLNEQNQAERIAQLKRPLLVLHAPRDEVVGVDNAARIFQIAKHPKSFVSLDDADHLLSNPTDADYAASVIAAWAARYVN